MRPVWYDLKCLQCFNLSEKLILAECRMHCRSSASGFADQIFGCLVHLWVANTAYLLLSSLMSYAAQIAAFELPFESPFPHAPLHSLATCRVAAETPEGCHKGSGTGSQLSSTIDESWTGPGLDTASAVQK